MPARSTSTHSSDLKTMQEIFHVEPLLGDAVNATDLSDPPPARRDPEVALLDLR